MVELLGVANRNKDRLAVLACLTEDELALRAVLTKLRTTLETSGAAQAMTDAYLGTAEKRLKDVANTLAQRAAHLGGRPFLARLWWVDEVLTALARVRTGRTVLGSGRREGENASLLDEGPPNMPPVATEDAHSVLHDRALSVPAPGVLASDWQDGYRCSERVLRRI